MAQIKRLGKDRDLKLDEIVPEEIVTPKVEKNYDQPEAVDKGGKATTFQVDNFPKSGVDTNQGPLLPNVILSKVTNIEDLKNLDREQIKTIQASLAKAGYDMPKSLKADGTYDGEAGEETLAMMQKWMDEQVLGEQVEGEQVEGEHGDVETRSMSTPDINFDPQFQQGGLLSLGMQEGGDPRDKYKDIDPRFYVESGMENVDPGFYAPSDARSRLDDLLGRVTLNGDSRDFDVEHPSIRDEMLMRAQEVPRGDGANAELYDGLSELGKESMRGRLLKKAGAEGYQEGGTVWNQGSGQNPNNQVSGGILSQVMGPKGPMNIPTRIGGFRVTG